MSEKKIVVPDGMITAVQERIDYLPINVRGILEAALLWLTKKPIVPKIHVAGQILADYRLGNANCCDALAIQFCCEEWQRRMFDAPDPEVPEVWHIIAKVLQDEPTYNGSFTRNYADISKNIALALTERGFEFRPVVSGEPEPKVHPILQEWIDDAKSKGVEPATIINYIRLFERAFQAGKDSK